MPTAPSIAEPAVDFDGLRLRTLLLLTAYTITTRDRLALPETIGMVPSSAEGRMLGLDLFFGDDEAAAAR